MPGPADPPAPPGTRADWTAEARALRRHHNIAPENCVAATAYALLSVLAGLDKGVKRLSELGLEEEASELEQSLIELTRNDPELQAEFLKSLTKDAGRLVADPGAR